MHPGAQCSHVWVNVGGASQVCTECGATCTRDKNGKIELYDRDPKAKA